MRSDRRFLLEHAYRGARFRSQELVGGAEPHQSTSDDNVIALHERTVARGAGCGITKNLCNYHRFAGRWPLVVRFSESPSAC